MRRTSRTLAKQIAEYVNSIASVQGGAASVTSSDVLKAVPELRGFDRLAAQVEEDYQATKRALKDLPDEDGLMQEQLNGYIELFTDAVGEAPEEPDDDDDDDDEDFDEDLDDEDDEVDGQPDELQENQDFAQDDLPDPDERL